MFAKHLVILLLLILTVTVRCDFKLLIIHINDFHARYEETGLDSGVCNDNNCIGGFSRVYTAVQQLRTQNKHSIFLNAGDYFQGSLWYNLFKADVTQFFWSRLPPDVMTFGNHDFDDGVSGLLPFIKNMNSQIVMSNMDDSDEPDIRGTYNKSTILNINGKLIGFVGVMSSEGDQVMPKVNLIFEDETEAVNREAKSLLAKGCFTVIVISHSGYATEMDIAKYSIPGVSVIVGGHSHTLLYSGQPPYGKSKGPYPTVVTRSDGSRVLVVQAACYTQYLGNLNVVYGDDGSVVDFSGDPIFLNSSIKRDPEIDKLMKTWKEQADSAGEKVVGRSVGNLDYKECKTMECPMGNFITEAMADFWREHVKKRNWDNCIPIAFTNSGGIRTGIGKGAIKYKDLIAAQPFGNSIDIGLLKGSLLRAAYEKSIEGNIIQQTGLRVLISRANSKGRKLLSIKVCCDYTRMDTCKKLDPEKYYRVTLPSYLSEGGDDISEFEELKERLIGPTDVDVFAQYVSSTAKLRVEVDGRISFLYTNEVLSDTDRNRNMSANFYY